MKQGRCSHTESVYTPGGQPGVDQKHQVQAQQRQGEVDEDLGGVVSPELSGATQKSPKTQGFGGNLVF